jgi:nucleotide-binding universal stress UspA family protein
VEPILRNGAAGPLLVDERPTVCALLTGTGTDSQICRNAIELSGCARDIALIVVRARLHASTAAAAGIDPRRLRHDIDMEARTRAKALCATHGLEGRCTFAVVDRLTPSACVKAAQDLRCDLLVVPDRWRTRLLRRAFGRAARRENIELLVVA